jgi:arsenical pump membrane protein
VALLTLIGIMTRPFRWNEASVAMAGATILILLGLITPIEAFSTLLRDWNTFLFFLGMMGIAALAEVANLFDWLAAQAARLAHQKSALLFLNVFLLGSAISMIFSNDATALILTPIVYVLVTKLRLPPPPFLFACTFIADTASFLLPVSNPINIIILSRFPLDLFAFVKLLFLPSLVVIAINIGVFFLIYRQHLTGRFEKVPMPDETIKHRLYFRYASAVLVIIGVTYLLATALQFRLSLVAIAGAIMLLIGAIHWKRITLGETTKRISWSILGFIAGMIIVVRAIEQTGMTLLFGRWLLQLSANTPFGAAMVGTIGSAVGTNLINNVPMAVLMISALDTLKHAPIAVQRFCGRHNPWM